MPGLILDGLTGAGKTTILDALLAHPGFAALSGGGPVLREDETFGELMGELREPAKTDIDRCRRLRRIVQRLAGLCTQATPQPGFVLERFHPSFYALMPTWRLYAYMDEALGRMGARLVVLRYPEDQFRRRVLERPGGAGLIEFYGGEAEALAELRRSQERRLEMLALTRLPHLTIDTADGRFEDAVRSVVEFWGS